MLARRSGQIVNITSVASRLSWPGAVAYTVARTAMRGFTNALRADLMGTGVSVVLATFGTVETPYWANNPGSRAQIPALARLVRVLAQSEVADAIARAIERDRKAVVLPRIFRPLFFLNELFPAAVSKFVTGR